MGLFVDMDPEEMMSGMEGNLDDPDLEAELAAITGDAPAGRAKPKGRSPLPMEDIAKMAEECMKDLNEEDDDDDVDDDDDLLVGTLESMMAAVKTGKPINEAEIPPPVATGAPNAAPRPAAPPVPSAPEQKQPAEAEDPAGLPGVPDSTAARSDETKTHLLERQREYKAAALRAKKQGDVEKAKLYFKASKVASTAQSAPSAPKDALEALEQRRAKYAEASAQAKAAGDDRKARMHDRIAKQYQSAIRAHKAGKPVNFDELPVPPGFPPIPGQKAEGAEEGFIAALEAANKLASTDAAEEEDDDDDDKGEEVGSPKCQTGRPFPCRSASKGKRGMGEKQLFCCLMVDSVRDPAAQQLEFLENRKKQFMKAALQAKQKNDMEQAKNLLRTAKGFDPMIEATRSGKSVDISTVPSPPGDEEDDFILVHHSDVQLSQKAEEVYSQLAKMLRDQHEKCLTHSKQFTHLGNVAETTKFEKMAEDCKKSMEVLKLAQAQGLPPPKHHFEEKSFRTVRIFPDLSGTDMVVHIVRGMNLPAPNGVQSNDLDAYIKFDFPFPSSEQPQRHKTTVVKNTNSPEYNQSFTLTINRNHRGFRRLVASKGFKLDLLHKGGFLRCDKPIGSALVKLDKLEAQSEIREIVEVMDGRKHTGGRVEVKVQLREPLSGQDIQTSKERWLVIDT
uniref:Coiled-coil and C2 domain containing 1B n=1 Tax=Oryzias sinensis TaxID=183150 RepID=A0A8C7YL05_9TELE